MNKMLLIVFLLISNTVNAIDDPSLCKKQFIGDIISEWVIYEGTVTKQSGYLRPKGNKNERNDILFHRKIVPTGKLVKPKDTVWFDKDPSDDYASCIIIKKEHLDKENVVFVE
jgi:hypothetical protein